MNEDNFFATDELEVDHLKNRIIKLVEDKAQLFGIMGTETVSITLGLKEEEVKQLETLELGDHYFWSLEENDILNVNYTEEI